MQAKPITLSTAIVLGFTALATAQEPANRAAPAPAPAQPTAVDVNQLPVNLSRLQRRLRASAEREQRDGLNLKYFIEVYATAPPLVLLTKEEALDIRPLPSSAPTHQDMLQMLTPRGLRPPPTGRIR
jgi:hypothetical protein